MAHNKLNLVRVHDPEGSHLTWQTDAEARALRWHGFTQWCSDTSLAGVAAVATVWKWARRPAAPHISELSTVSNHGELPPRVPMRIDAQV